MERETKRIMDDETRQKYEAWKWRRIKKRVIYPSICFGTFLIVLLIIIVSCKNNNTYEKIAQEDSGEDLEIDQVDEVVGFYPIIYIFNSHPSEMIGATHEVLDDGEMYVVEVSHMLAERLENYGLPTLVEERCVNEKLLEQGLQFPMAFQAANEFVKQAKSQHPSIEFFIDLHRDGISHTYATVEIEGNNYARILFVIGTDNPNGYQESYEVANQLHNLLEKIYPGISRGILFSGGAGRDGIYNQDITPKLQLIEVGTVDSTVEEISRTIDVLATVLATHILENSQ